MADRRAVVAGTLPSFSSEVVMKRWAFLLYGVACHVLFLATYVYMALFVGNHFLAKTIDEPVGGPVIWAVLVDLLLLAAFGLQHSIMARPGFKAVWTRVVPKPIERSTYVLASCAVVALLMWQWRPIDSIVWDVQQPLARALLICLFAVGWLMVPAVTMMISHFDLFGTRQIWLYFRRQPYTALPFRTPMLYGHVRHPLYIGWALAFWATPTMTAGHMLFAGVLTAYMGLAAITEERDLVAYFGRQYQDYRQRVPMFVPSLKSRTVAKPDRPTESQPAAS
jgi:protein-S-isoprenylcysteine O-methyltransferase Ste14